MLDLLFVLLGTFIGLGGGFSKHFYIPSVTSIPNETLTQFKVFTFA